MVASTKRSRTWAVRLGSTPAQNVKPILDQTCWKKTNDTSFTNVSRVCTCSPVEHASRREIETWRLCTCMHCTRLPLWTELKRRALEANRVVDFRPENCFTELDSRQTAAGDAAATIETETTADAIATNPWSLRRELESAGTDQRRNANALGNAG